MIANANRMSLEHCRSDLTHRGFTWDGESEATEDGKSERWTKTIGAFRENGIWTVTITARSLNGTKAIGHFVKVEIDIPEQEASKLWSVLDRFGHNWR
jgi:hypothetical protein